jgi:hypothetical protein
VQIMMLLGIQTSMAIVQAAVVRGLGKPHWDMLSALVVALVTAGLLILAAPHWLEVVTAAVVVSAVAVWPLDALFVRRLTGLSASGQFATAGRAGLAAAVMAVAVWGVTPLLLPILPAAAVLAIQIAFGAVLYWAMLRVLMPAVAAIIGRVLVAVARRDLGTVRASLGLLAG